MPEVVCDNNSDNYDLHVEGVIPIMSFDEAIEKFENIHILITSDLYLNEIMEQVIEKVPMERVFYFTSFEISKYIKEIDYSKSEFYMPKHLKKIQDKLRYYQDLYAKGENIKIRTDDFFIKSDDKYVYLIDYMDRNVINIKLPTGALITRDIYKLEIYNKRFLIRKFNIASEYIYNKNINIEKSIENIISFNKYLASKNIPFAYIQAPHIVSSLKGNDFENLYDDANRNADKLIQKLNENNINTLDFREYVMKNNIKTEDWFFRTDFHWTPRAAFEANKVICEYIAKHIDCEFNYEYFDLKNYNIETYEDVLLGSLGKNVGLLYAEGGDNFEMITPKFKTDFSWICEEKGYNNRGEAKDALVFHEQLKSVCYKTYMYLSYSLVHGNYTIIKNNCSIDNKKLMLINDSFARPLSMFISQQFEEVHFFDFRQGDFNRKLFEAIEEVKPDMVLMMYHPPHTLKGANGFDVGYYA